MIHLLLAMALFLSPTDPQLNEVSYDVCPCDIPSEEIQTLIDDMYTLAFGESQDRMKAVLVGLAAPQIGVQKRIILVDRAATGVFTKEIEPPPPKITEHINPVILWQSEDQVVWREGCFSTDRICGLVPRSNRVIVRYYDREGNIFTEEFSGYTARIFQHEIDHLDGIRFPDRIENDDDLHWVEPNQIPEYRIHWANWQTKYARKNWEEIKHAHDR